jgi:hypothetical protein
MVPSPISCLLKVLRWYCVPETWAAQTLIVFLVGIARVKRIQNSIQFDG